MNIDPAPPSVLAPRLLRAGRLEQIASLQPTHALTLAFNKTVNALQVQQALRVFHAHLDREIFGRRFCRMPRSRRTAFIAVPEHIDSNTHVHAVLCIAPDRHDRVEHLLSGDRSSLWPNRLAPAGTHRLVRLNDTTGWASYCLKFANLNTDWITSDEFLPEIAFAA